VDAQQVLVLEVTPAREAVEPRLFGLPGTVEESGSGYLAKVRGPQGTSGRLAAALPEGSPPITGCAVRQVLPREDRRQPSITTLTLVASDTRGALVDITFPRQQAPTELRTWTVRPGALSPGMEAGWCQEVPEGEPVSFPLSADTPALGPLAAFCGAYVDSAFGEDQEVWIDLLTDGPFAPDGADAGRARHPFTSREALPASHPLSPLATHPSTAWWLQTRFSLPFLPGYGCESRPGEHTLLVFPLLPHVGEVQLRAWINGAPLPIQLYSYPRNRALGCRYADLLGTAATHGDNTIILHADLAGHEVT
jgi:hypothetical protein